MNKLLLTSTFVIGLAAGQMANALTITTEIGGSAPANASYVNFDDGTAGALTIVITPDAKLVDPAASVSGQYAQPYVSGNNNQFFGSLYVGPDNTPYLTTGSPTASDPSSQILLMFPNSQNGLGLLWGSVDTYNHIKFYASANGSGAPIAEVDGSMLGAPGLLVNNPPDNQGEYGTAYVTIRDIPAFQSVVFYSTQKAFEFDNVSYNIADGGTTAALLGLGLTGLGFLARRKV